LKAIKVIVYACAMKMKLGEL